MAKKEISVEQKLKALYDLQQIMSEVDGIRTLRGELPLEVEDLEAEVEGLSTRIGKYNTEIADLEKSIAAKKNEIIEAKAAVQKYEEQQKGVRNNREFDSLSKEIEFQGLEVQLAEKHIREFTAQIANKTIVLNEDNSKLEGRKSDLATKQGELDKIISETKSDEEKLREKGAKLEEKIEPRLLSAFKRVRNNAKNGLAVVAVDRGACSGCFNSIPPQRQLDIRLHKKVIVCEFCGRIMVDNSIEEIKA